MKEEIVDFGLADFWNADFKKEVIAHKNIVEIYDNGILDLDATEEASTDYKAKIIYDPEKTILDRKLRAIYPIGTPDVRGLLNRKGMFRDNDFDFEREKW